MIICKRPAHMDDHLQKAGSGGNDDKDNNNNDGNRGDGGRSPGWQGWPGVTVQKEEKKEKEKHYIKPFHQPLLASRKELWGYVKKN